MRRVIVTYLPSPYQVELLNAIAAARDFNLVVIYICWSAPTPIARNWQTSGLRHEFVRLTEDKLARDKATEMVLCADFVVFNYYRHPDVVRWMKECDKNGVRWCFWGERLGATRVAPLGSLYRRLKLSPLHGSHAPIWGIGQWAVEQYRAEFGEERSYLNVPYFSDLQRFADVSRFRNFHSQTRNLLFSGSLIKRKGVDLLACAFNKVAHEFPNLTLSFMGTGELENELRRQLAPFGERVRFLGFQSWEDLPKHYAEADILCAPSRYDGWGLIVPEAMASGLPVIGTDRTGAAWEFVRDGHNGLLVPAGREAPLRDALRRVASWSVEELRSISDSARSTIREHSLENGTSRFLAAVRQSTATVIN
jgi:glycosyltransferase involved in cell wall biosynthesis